MKLIRPFAVDSTNLTSNIPEAAPAEYAAGTTYNAGQQVSVTTGYTSLVYESLAGSNTGNTPASSPTWWAYVATTYAEYSSAATYALGDTVISAVLGTPTHHAYESLQASNTGNALTDATKWLDLGSTNKFAMFDTVNGTTTESENDIDVTIDVTGRADGVALFGLDAESVQIIMTTVADGEVYNETFSLQTDSGITSWYDWFTEEIVYSADFFRVDLPPYTDPTLQIIISSTTGIVSCGTCVVGQLRDLGGTTYGARTGIQDYSRKEANDLGDYTLVERSYSKRGTFKVFCDNDQIDAYHQILSELRATPTVFVGTDDYASTLIFGFMRDWASSLDFTNKSYLTIDVEGLT